MLVNCVFGSILTFLSLVAYTLSSLAFSDLILRLTIANLNSFLSITFLTFQRNSRSVGIALIIWLNCLTYSLYSLDFLKVN